MPVDVVGRKPQAALEAVELALDLGPDLAAVEQAEQGPRDQTPRRPGNAPVGASRGIGPAGAQRQIEMQADRQMAAVHAQSAARSPANAAR